jgi:beta-phosphoglucomutase
MRWIRDFQLFLFDFDGLLVNTEPLHYQAYVNMLGARGYTLDWSFEQFCRVAHLNATALKEEIYATFPDLDPNWNQLYQEKKKAYYELIGSGKIQLMPGVERLLNELEKAQIARCVVTNSLLEQIVAIRAQLKPLQSIPHWITREDYEKPKPHPECYLKAIQLYGKAGGRSIGFEDSLRGLEALMGTPAFAVLVCPVPHPLVKERTANVLHVPSFEHLFQHFQN